MQCSYATQTHGPLAETQDGKHDIVDGGISMKCEALESDLFEQSGQIRR